MVVPVFKADSDQDSEWVWILHKKRLSICLSVKRIQIQISCRLDHSPLNLPQPVVHPRIDTAADSSTPWWGQIFAVRLRASSGLLRRSRLLYIKPDMHAIRTLQIFARQLCTRTMVHYFTMPQPTRAYTPQVIQLSCASWRNRQKRSSDDRRLHVSFGFQTNDSTVIVDSTRTSISSGIKPHSTTSTRIIPT